jgi:hypothetical protein
MTKRIKLMPDYGCSPLWEYADGDLVANPQPDELPLSDGLRAALRRWAEAYDATLKPEDPRASGFAAPAAEAAFEANGQRLWKQLREELGHDSEVFYFSHRDGRIHEPEAGTHGEHPTATNASSTGPSAPERADAAM